MSRSRNTDYSDVYFCETDSAAVLKELVAKYGEITGRTLSRADPVMLFIKWVAAIVVQQNININEAARQNVPRYADGEFLDSLGELFFNVKRLSGAAASTVLRFTISAARDEDIVIEAGTRVKSGELVFGTAEAAVIPAGETWVDVFADAAENGTAYNGLEVGSVSTIIDPFPFFSAVSNITVTGGGVNVEDDKSYYNRMRESLEGYSTAGAVGGYKYYAESADARIADVSVTSPTAGNVLIKVLLKDGQLPDADVLEKVEKAVNADEVRPLTDLVSVRAPEVVNYGIDVKYYMTEGTAESTEKAAEAVRAALDEFAAWECAKMGRDINPSRLISMIMSAAEVKRVEVIEPVYTAVAAGTVALAESVSVTFGGIEDE